MRLSYIFASCCTLLSVCTLAEQPDTRAHQHGVARLELFQLATDLQISFYATASDILGFEHQPETQAELDAVKKAKTLLAEPDKLFSIAGADCHLKHHQSNLAELQQHAEAEHKDSHYHDHKHTGHSDIESSYQFSCTSVTEPVTVRVNLFSLFPDLQQIQSSWITQKGQSAATLTPADHQLSLN
ncbi:DUF2796 domain-containing protein [Rheinheimera soli]|uniref:DUF2796 domain-containing protein n=1 Tax=Rheinheimera soli TaxID=443616 RepID=A0ABU1VWL8_9GAMM|nr:DUF2796 domain-containing protein [Rheinheimera soli]MDR7120087.1 hypothetical protein [Rheinheimera soli]